jgi:hypothetical protein
MRSVAGSGCLLAALLAAGCASYRAEYNPVYVPTSPGMGRAVEGAVILHAPPEDADYVATGRPRSVHAIGMTLSLPLGEIVTETGARVLAQAFSGGCTPMPRVAATSNCVAIVRFKTRSFWFAFNQARDLTMNVYPQVRLGLEMTVKNPAGTTLLAKRYDSGEVSDESAKSEPEPEEAVNRLVHRAVHALLREAAADAQNAVIPPLIRHAGGDTAGGGSADPAAVTVRARLHELKRLYEEGLISRRVYEEKQRDIMREY